MKKFKLISIGLGVGIITTTLILTSGILVNIPLINAAGSSAVQSLMVAFSNKYHQSDLVTQAGGSGAGIRAIIDDNKEIGMASKDPKIFENIAYANDQKIWIDREIKTFTVAWDGMGIIYKSRDKNTKIDINESTISKIYQIFAGNHQFKFSDIDPSIRNDEIITPFARSGGAIVSGTADAFYHDSQLLKPKNNLEPKNNDAIDKALINGEYGPYTKTTSESNSQAWSFVKNENKVGSMVYLSAGFIQNNLKEIENSGFKVATYKGKEMNKETITNGYNWYRPLNLMLSIKQNKQNKQNEKIKIIDINSQNLINWILWDPQAKKIIEEQGYVALTREQVLEHMCLDKNINTLWTADDKEIFESFDKKPKIRLNNE